jgi:alpha-1,3-glucan synthase
MGSNVSLAQFNRPGTPDSIASAPPSPVPDSRRLSHSPQNPSQGYFDNQLSTGAAYHDRFKQPDPKRGSAESFYDEEPNASELYYDDRKRRSGKPKFFQGSYDDEDAPSSQGSSDHGDSNTLRSQQPGVPQSYDNFLAAANRQFSKQTGGRNQPDPYFQPDSSRNSISEGFAPSRPFTTHSRTSSFDSISSIVEDKGTSSPLNKAMDSFTDSDGEVATSFVQKLRDLSSDNSKGDLCIEKFLIKSEKAFFDEIKKEKMSSCRSAFCCCVCLLIHSHVGQIVARLIHGRFPTCFHGRRI